MLATINKLERLLEIAQTEGILVRKEWLRGVRGGLVRIGKTPILFLDESLSVTDQCEQAIRALGQLDWSETPSSGEMLVLLKEKVPAGQ